jgi:2',3'-cyclic-nucleotide 2'-phosphodiesterase (5'-nucleotidase family)
MAENQQLQQVQESSSEAVSALHETNQTMAQNLQAMQDRNLRFVQNVLVNSAELLTQQTESMQRLQQQWIQQLPSLQDATFKLTAASFQLFFNWLLAPFSFTRQIVDVTESTMQREREQVK